VRYYPYWYVALIFIHKKEYMKQLIKITLILLLATGTGNLYAQKQGQAQIDSLLKELPRQREDTIKVKLLVGLSFGYSVINADEGIKYGQQCLELATKVDWKKGIASAYNCLGLNYRVRSDYPKALEYYFKALKLDEETGNKKGIAALTCNIGVVYQDQSDYPGALEYLFKALKLDEEGGFKLYAANVTGNIGNIYTSESDYPKALEYLFKALKLDEEGGDKLGIAINSGNIGKIYTLLSDYPKALEYYFKAVKLDEEGGYKLYAANVSGNIGTVYYKKGDYPKALEYYFKALKFYEEGGYKQYAASVTCCIGGLYIWQGNYSEGITYCIKSLKICEEIGDKSDAAINLGIIGCAYVSIVIHAGEANKAGGLAEMGSGDYIPDSLIPHGRSALLHRSAEYLQKAIAISKEIGDLHHLQEFYEGLSATDSLLGDYRSSLEDYKLHTLYKDSVFNEAKKTEVMRLGMVRKMDVDSLKAAQQRQVIELKFHQQRNYTYLGLAGMLLLIGFSFFIVRERGKSETERKKSDALLLNILPAEIAAELKSTGVSDAKHFDNVTVLFTDFVNFTNAGERMTPKALVDELHTCFKAFDEITGKYNIEKIKTIGDAYLAVCGNASGFICLTGVHNNFHICATDACKI